MDTGTNHGEVILLSAMTIGDRRAQGFAIDRDAGHCRQRLIALRPALKTHRDRRRINLLHHATERGVAWCSLHVMA